jgi:DNA-binding SARP family transcriptional activator
MTRLTLKLLGAPEVSLGGQVLAFPTRKALALLAYLVVEGQTQARENLVAFFWPASDTAHGHASLRRTLVHLRHTLGEISPHPLNAIPWVLISRPILRLTCCSSRQPGQRLAPQLKRMRRGALLYWLNFRLLR